MGIVTSFQMCTLSYFTNSALGYFTNFYLHYFIDFSKLENKNTKQINKNPSKSNQQAYPIQKHYLNNYKNFFSTSGK